MVQVREINRNSHHIFKNKKLTPHTKHTNTFFYWGLRTRYPPQPTAHRFASGDSAHVSYFLFFYFSFYDNAHTP